MKRIGVFDSGVGGLSVWRELASQMPDIDTLYLADQAHIPYGPQAPESILEYSRSIVRFLQQEGCTVIVIACNTASAVALHRLRAENPQLVFVGMEPAIKPAAEMSRSGTVAVLATATTLEGQLFSDTVSKHATDMRVIRQPCPGLVEQIERGETASPATLTLLRIFLEQPLLAGADTFVLACTHYAFVRQAIQQLTGSSTQVVDPAPAIARRLRDLLQDEKSQQAGESAGQHVFYTTGDSASFDRVASQLLEQPIQSKPMHWNSNGGLESAQNQ
jgi:glutamate racemase